MDEIKFRGKSVEQKAIYFIHLFPAGKFTKVYNQVEKESDF